jgi:hypothetical protein
MQQRFNAGRRAAENEAGTQQQHMPRCVEGLSTRAHSGAAWTTPRSAPPQKTEEEAARTTPTRLQRFFCAGASRPHRTASSNIASALPLRRACTASQRRGGGAGSALLLWLVPRGTCARVRQPVQRRKHRAARREGHDYMPFRSRLLAPCVHPVLRCSGGAVGCVRTILLRALFYFRCGGGGVGPVRGTSHARARCRSSNAPTSDDTSALSSPAMSSAVAPLCASEEHV